MTRWIVIILAVVMLGVGTYAVVTAKQKTPEVAMQQPEQIATESYIPRQIETELDAHFSDRIGWRIRPQQDACWLAGDQQKQERGIDFPASPQRARHCRWPALLSQCTAIGKHAGVAGHEYKHFRGVAESIVVRHPYGRKPELRESSVALDMNVPRLVSVAGEEEKPVRAALQDGRTHAPDSVSFVKLFPNRALSDPANVRLEPRAAPT